MTDQRLRRREAADAGMSTQVACFLLGGTVGALVALLFAPKSGRELRGDIADVTRKGVDRTRDAAGQIGTRAGEYYDVAQQKAGELAGAARDAAARRGEHFSAAIEAGKRAYEEEKRRTETGGTTSSTLATSGGSEVGNH